MRTSHCLPLWILPWIFKHGYLGKGPSPVETLQVEPIPGDALGDV